MFPTLFICPAVLFLSTLTPYIASRPILLCVISVPYYYLVRKLRNKLDYYPHAAVVSSRKAWYNHLQFYENIILDVFEYTYISTCFINIYITMFMRIIPTMHSHHEQLFSTRFSMHCEQYPYPTIGVLWSQVLRIIMPARAMGLLFIFWYIISKLNTSQLSHIHWQLLWLVLWIVIALVFVHVRYIWLCILDQFASLQHWGKWLVLTFAIQM